MPLCERNLYCCCKHLFLRLLCSFWLLEIRQNTSGQNRNHGFLTGIAILEDSGCFGSKSEGDCRGDGVATPPQGPPSDAAWGQKLPHEWSGGIPAFGSGRREQAIPERYSLERSVGRNLRPTEYLEVTKSFQTQYCILRLDHRIELTGGVTFQILKHQPVISVSMDAPKLIPPGRNTDHICILPSGGPPPKVWIRISLLHSLSNLHSRSLSLPSCC